MTQPEEAPTIHETDAREILAAHRIDRGMDPRTAAQIVKELRLLPVELPGDISTEQMSAEK